MATVITARVMTIRAPQLRQVPDNSSGKLIMFEVPDEIVEKALSKLAPVNGVKLTREDIETETTGKVWGSAWIPKAIYPQLRRVSLPAMVELEVRFLGATQQIPEQGAEPQRTTLSFILDRVHKATPWDGLSDDVAADSLNVRQRIPTRRVMSSVAESYGENPMQQPNLTL